MTESDHRSGKDTVPSKDVEVGAASPIKNENANRSFEESVPSEVDDTDVHVDDGDDDIVSTLDLRKNLVLTFDDAYGAQGAESSLRTDEVTEKESKAEGKKRVVAKSSKTEMKKRSRPPIAPPIQPKNSSKRTHEIMKNSLLKEDLKPLLSVYLRVRPPVAPGSTNSHDSMNTVEIITGNVENITHSTSIRTYPPISSNAAKCFRGDIKRKKIDSRSINSISTDVTSGITSDESSAHTNTVAGVKEFDFNQVFTPTSHQEEIYKEVAAPLVEGLFPKQQMNIAKKDTLAVDGKSRFDGMSPLKKKGKGHDGEMISGSTSNAKGQSALLFAYGITNAGKTHTIVGDTSSSAIDNSSKGNTINPQAGILPRSLEHMLSKIEVVSKNDPHNNYVMYMSYLEIYNECIYDLLPFVQKQGGYDSASSAASVPTRRLRSQGSLALRLREDRNGHIFVKGLSKHKISSVQQGIKLANIAKEKRHTSSNNINNDSSRSHCVCQLELSVVPKLLSIDDEDTSVSSSLSSDKDNSTNLWIVDLAGIERSKRTGMMYKSARQKEATLINASLMKLMRCLQTMSNNQNMSTASNEIVPFRESKLTHLFMNHLTGTSASHTSMIVNINPAAADFDETQHVLSYATVARTVKTSTQDYFEKLKAIAGVEVTKKDKEREKETEPARISNESEKLSIEMKEKSPRKKVAKIVQKLSPRAMLKKKRERKATLRTKAINKQSTRSAMSSGTSAKGKLISSKTDSIQKQVPEIDQLRASLQKLQNENAKLNDEIELLKEEQLHRDSELRMVMGQEMEKEIREIREHYETLIKKNRVQSNPTPIKTIKTLQTERQEKFIQELMEKNDECEDEMERMSERHKDELESQRQKYDDLLKAKCLDIEKLQDLNKAIEKAKDDECNRLKEKLQISQLNFDEIKKENEHLISCMENDSVNEVDDGSLGSSMQNEKGDENKELIVMNNPGLRRLPTNRCSEVACLDVNVVKSDSSKKTSKKKKCYPLRSRDPLSSIIVANNN